jgi:hypothetical protein
VVVAVITVGVVEVIVDEVVDVIAVRHRRVAAPLAVSVLGVVVADVVPGSAAVRMCVVDCDYVFVDMALVRVVEMSVMQIVDMVVVCHRNVPAAWSVLMRMVGMDLVVAHALECRNSARARAICRE